VELQRVGAETCRAAEREKHHPRMFAGYSEVLARGQCKAPFGMGKGGVVDVVAYVVLVGPHRSVMGKPEILREDEIEGASHLRCVSQ